MNYAYLERQDFGAPGLNGAEAESLRMVGGQELRGDEPGACRPTAPADRGDEITKAQILAAMHEYAWTFHGYHGRGPEVEAKHAAVAALLDEAGVL